MGVGFVGLSGVIRDSMVCVLAAWELRSAANWTEVAELMAIKMGLQLAVGQNFQVHVIECDASNIVRQIFNGVFLLFPLTLVITEVKHLLCPVGGGSCWCISHDVNEVAHSLATSMSPFV